MKKSLAVRILACILSMALTVPLFAACASSPEVMTIGGWSVSYDLLRYFVMNYMTDYEGLTVADFRSSPDLQRQLTDNTIKSLSTLAAYNLLAKKHGVSLSRDEEKEVEASLEDLKKSYESDEAYRKAMEENFITEDVYRTIMRTQTLCDDMYDYLTDEYYGIFKSDDATIEADIAAGNWFSAEYMLITYSDASQYESRKAAAEEIRTQLVSDGTVTMAGLRDEYSKVWGLGINYAMLGAFTYTQEKQYFEDAVLSLEIGGYSEVLDESDGFLIVHRLPVTDGYIEENFISVFCAGYLEREFFRYVEEAAEGYKVTYAKKYQDMKFWEME